MRTKTRWVLGFFGVILLVFGLACLNYTKADGLEHHREVARIHNLPPPSDPILYGGVVSLILGAGTIGFVLARNKTQRREP
jgi:hypothetical protein